MPLKKFVLQPGFIRDGTQYAAGGGWWNGQWVRFHIGSPQSMGGWQMTGVSQGSKYTGDCRSLFAWTALNGIGCLAIGTTTNYYIATEGVLHNITPAALPPAPGSSVYGYGFGTGSYGFGPWGQSSLSGTATPLTWNMRLWSQANWGQDLLFCDKDQPNGIYYWKYDRAFAAAPQPLASLAAGCPYIGRMLFVTEDRHAVILGATQVGAAQQDLMNVWWSDIEHIVDPVPPNPAIPPGSAWTPSDTNEAGSFRLAIGSQIVSGRVARMENLIWTDWALYSMKYVGTPYIFGFSLIAHSISIAGQNVTVDNGSAVFWLGQGEFYAYSGAVEILPCPVRDYVFNNMNMPYSGKFHAGLNRQFGEVWWFYVSVNATEIDSYVVYNWVDNLWYFGTIQRTAWLDPAIGQYPYAAWNGNIYNHEFGADADGQPLYASIESADLDLDDGHHFVYCHRVLPDIHFMSNIANPNPAPTATVTVNFKPGPEMATSKSVSAQYAQAGGMIYVRGRGRAASFKIESANKGVTWRIGNMRADVQPDGRR